MYHTTPGGHGTQEEALFIFCLLHTMSRSPIEQHYMALKRFYGGYWFTYTF